MTLEFLALVIAGLLGGFGWGAIEEHTDGHFVSIVWLLGMVGCLLVLYVL